LNPLVIEKQTARGNAARIRDCPRNCKKRKAAHATSHCFEKNGKARCEFFPEKRKNSSFESGHLARFVQPLTNFRAGRKQEKYENYQSFRFNLFTDN
jgi:hypothetical protein